jgi:hypothetical protein
MHIKMTLMSLWLNCTYLPSVTLLLDRCAMGLTDTEAQPFSRLLAKLDVVARKTVQLNKLHHRSKTSKRIVERKKREAKLEMKYMQLQVATPL